MSNIVKESLNVTCKDRINLLFLPSGLDIHDKAGTCIGDRGALSPSKLVVREEAFGIGEVLEPLGCRQGSDAEGVEMMRRGVEMMQRVQERCRGLKSEAQGCSERWEG